MDASRDMLNHDYRISHIKGVLPQVGNEQLKANPRFAKVYGWVPRADQVRVIAEVRDTFISLLDKREGSTTSVMSVISDEAAILPLLRGKPNLERSAIAAGVVVFGVAVAKVLDEEGESQTLGDLGEHSEFFQS